MVGLFDIINIMFEHHEKWNTVTNYDKERNSFMINRYMSIKYPVQSNLLQLSLANKIEICNFWFNYISSKYTKLPKWIYIKGSKKSKENKIEPKLIKLFAQYNNVECKYVEDYIDIFGDSAIEEIKMFNKK